MGVKVDEFFEASPITAKGVIVTDIHHASLEGEIGELLRLHSLSLAVAESATAGLISARIVNIAGASEYFVGGVVAYANSVKENILGIPGQVLSRDGAVSEATAIEMAEGVRRLLSADIGISDTGVAGPNGSTPMKPIGLFYLGLAAGTGPRVQEFFFSGTRGQIREQAAEHTLLMLRDYLRGLG